MFITFEGGEGTGKSTIIKEIQKLFIKNGMEDFIVTREPGGIEIAEEIRNILLNKENNKMDKVTEALLFAASRRQHLVEKIKPALDQGKTVLCDRYVDSSIVYQGIARGIGAKKVMQINKLAIEEYLPDLTFIIDLDPKIGIDRINNNKDREINRLDLEKMEFHNKIRQGYLNLIKNGDERFVLIDGDRSVEKIVGQVFDLIKNKIDNQKDIVSNNQ